MLTPWKNLHTGTSLWLSLPYPKTPSQKLCADKKSDIAIIGAGITGAMAAQSLAAAGFNVILLDRRGPLKGSTTATTALLQYELDIPLSKLQKSIGMDKANRAWWRSRLGLGRLHALIASLNIECDVTRLPSLYLSGNVLNAEALREEWTARNAIGLHTIYHGPASLYENFTFRRDAALQSFDNISVNPLCLSAGFLRKAIEQGAQIFAPVDAQQVECLTDGVIIHTNVGYSITARHVIFATGYEIPKLVPQNRHSIYSTYVITTRPQPEKLRSQQYMMLWEASLPYLYVRTTRDGRVICGGEDEASENEEQRDALLPAKIAVLEKKLKDLLPELDTQAEYAWCGTFGSSPTGMPTIGAVPGLKDCYAIMAFGGNGIIFSQIAAELLTAQFTGKHDPDANLFAFVG